jgi:hypothetical protein
LLCRRALPVPPLFSSSVCSCRFRGLAFLQVLRGPSAWRLRAGGERDDLPLPEIEDFETAAFLA